MLTITLHPFKTLADRDGGFPESVCGPLAGHVQKDTERILRPSGFNNLREDRERWGTLVVVP